MFDFLEKQLKIAHRKPMTKDMFPSRKFLLQENKVRRTLLKSTKGVGLFYSFGRKLLFHSMQYWPEFKIKDII